VVKLARVYSVLASSDKGNRTSGSFLKEGSMTSVKQEQANQGFVERIMYRAFARPEGLLGRIGGHLLALEKHKFIAWLVTELAVSPGDQVLEVGFGPGVAIAYLAAQTPAGHVAGVDISAVMVAQASRRNAEAIAAGRVELHQGSADHLPFPNGVFDKAMSINSAPIWPDPLAGLREIQRVLKPGGVLALGFVNPTLSFVGEAERLLPEAGFATVHREKNDEGVGLLAVA
jgi:SAM-dependent methyltransferase